MLFTVYKFGSDTTMTCWNVSALLPATAASALGLRLASGLHLTVTPDSLLSGSWRRRITPTEAASSPVCLVWQ